MTPSHGSVTTPRSAYLILALVLGAVPARRLIDQINLWSSCSGPEWTVKRLKAVWAAALQLRAGNIQEVMRIYQENSISYYHGSLIPRGPLGKAVRGFVKAQRPAALRRYAACLKVYTAFKLSRLTPAQYVKAFKAITGEYTGDPQALQAIVKIVRRQALKDGIKSLIPRLHEADLSRLKPYTSTHIGNVSWSRSARQIHDSPYGKSVSSLASSGYLPEELGRKLLYPKTSDSAFLVQFRAILAQEDSRYLEPRPGHIAFIQEASCKARVVAVPNAWCQWAFEPLHHALDHVIRQLPESSMHDQNKGGYFIKDHLMRGDPLWSFDLSSATDRFPRKIQTELLSSLGLKCYGDALEELCQQSWLSSPTNESWRYKVGQPMGLYGSFPLFHLTHILLLRAISEACHARPLSFRVLGDDVIISDHKVARIYSAILAKLGVEVSAAKSLSSRSAAEFAGFIGLKTNKSVTLFRPYKFGSGSRIHAAVPFIFAMGRAVRALGPWWSQKFIEFQKTRSWRSPDLSPLIPDDWMGGLEPPTLDPSRLENLLAVALGDSSPFTDYGDFYDSEDNIFADAVNDDIGIVQGTSYHLLGKQVEVPVATTRLPSELLQTPKAPERDPQEPLVGAQMDADPLMRKYKEIPPEEDYSAWA